MGLIENCLPDFSENNIVMVELILNCSGCKWLLLFCSLKIAGLFSVLLKCPLVAGVCDKC